MKTAKNSLAGGLLAALFFVTPAIANDAFDEKHIITVQTNGAEVFEADVSELVPGESRTFITNSGSTIDILKAADGIELYIDGELQDMDGAELHDHLSQLHEEIEFNCETEDGECDNVFAYAYSDDASEGGAHVKVISKHTEYECTDEEDCIEMVWVSADDESTTVKLHEHEEMVSESDSHNVIVIKKTKTISDSD